MNPNIASCPLCLQSLPAEEDTAYCPQCDLYLAGIPTAGRRIAGYALSLPERLSRAAAGSVAGLFKGTLELLLPEAIRRTKLYEVLLQKNLRYLIQEIGSVADVYADATTLPSRYAARKFVGNFVELAGILTLRASPVWILALVSDLSGGTKSFFRELTEELKLEGLVAPEAKVENVDQLLDGLQSLAGKIADHMDVPPLSLAELRETLGYLRNETQKLKLSKSMNEGEMESMLRSMKEVAHKEQKTLFEISSAMALGAVNQLQRSGRTAVTGIRVGRALLNRSILEYYSRALRDISRRGYYRYWARSSRPYLRAIARHLAWRRISHTERYFLSRVWGRPGREKKESVG